MVPILTAALALTCGHERPLLAHDLPPAPSASALVAGANDGYVDSGGVKIHFVSLGRRDAPLLVLVHGFPDFWYSWRAQMPALARDFHVVAIDQRGYNQSGQPHGVENYTLARLVDDLLAVIKHFGTGKVVVVGHDWGGLVAWTFAMAYPELTDRLVVLNLPHPRGILRELATNPKQQRNSQYARDFQRPDAAAKITVDALVNWVKDPDVRRVYRDALARSSVEGMLNYYKANYPRDGESARDAAAKRSSGAATYSPVRCPVLLIHGLQDQALLPGALNDTWDWVDSDLTLVTIPRAGHFVQQDAADLVTRAIVSWLKR
jgi:pimeloyl-ACP methyl ester carboxylesterase